MSLLPHFSSSPALTRAGSDDNEPIETTIRAIRALGDLLRSSDASCEDLAIEAVQCGRPAFWTSATYHNQAAVRFAQLANSGRLDDALAACAIADIEAASPRELIASLIPLNPRAREALAEARRRLWRMSGMPFVADAPSTDAPAPSQATHPVVALDTNFCIRGTHPPIVNRVGREQP